MKITHAPSFRRTRLASACGLLLAGVTAAHAQGAASAAAPASAASASDNTPITVTVTGIRASLESSMALKRDAHGIVDGITAEDVGKFPDSNLAEAMQRISGVSIDRVAGEGSKVTVRGFGPDYNMILLNGRQMPATTVADTGPSGSRAFDFANLAAESISGLEVWKTSRASQPAGGIGATINIKTARPLDNYAGRIASVGVQGLIDRSNQRLPSDDRGKSITPEISGIYSDTFADHTFGVALTGNYEERDGGYNSAGVTSGWRTCPATSNGENCWGGVALPGEFGSDRITNRPSTGMYAVPQNIDYAVSGIHRERVNGQLTLQWQPSKAFTSTLDYTYSQNRLDTKRNDISSWFNFGDNSTSSWTNGPAASPTFYSEELNNPNYIGGKGPRPLGPADVAMGVAKFGVKTTLRSLGVNLNWKASDSLKFELDAHSSSSISGSDNPYGTNNVIGTAAFNRGTTSVDFTHDFPVMSLANTPRDASLQQVAGSAFRNSYMKANVDQLQLKGAWEASEESSVDFGLNVTHVKNRTAYANVQQDSWGGATNAADYPDNVWHPDTLSKYFSRMSGSNSPALFNTWFTDNFDQIRGIAASVGDPTHYVASADFDGPGGTDRRTKENTLSLYGQYNRDWTSFGMPMNLSAGLRYEKTDVTANAVVPTPAGTNMVSNNEFDLTYSGREATTLKGGYKYLLPSIDYDAEVVRNVKVRFSYGETIARPGWDQIQGGRSLDQLFRVDGGTGSQGNPALKPVLSHNLDGSVEWYYGKSSYASVGFFHKNVQNFIGQGQTTYVAKGLPTPVNGAYWNAAVNQGGCGATDTGCIRSYIFANYDGQPGVNKTTGKISGQPGDPDLTFKINTPVNQHSASLRGFEFNVQNVFGSSGFGVSANYTLVMSGLKYDNSNLNDQFALVGLSNSANVVAFYEDEHVNARVAYNWRGQFLASKLDGAGPNPVYTEPYGQVDMTLGYNFDKHLSFQLDAINLNDGVLRQHSRNTDMLESITQTGRRFMIGARYKF
ncbi:MAG: TonB-dependent receptor [Pseudomonadota bacterium]|nr:TonB-dependent receptor [Pseudomonadota bacterium]